MNRKLSATQILHGARAYSHNASRRAHQLSGPKRVRVLARPVHGETYGSDSDLIRTFVHDEVCEECGYHVCSKAGICAPVVAAKPSARALDNLPAEPSPAGGRDPYEAAGHPWARVGMRVRYLESGHSFAQGSILVVATAKLDFVPLLSRVWVKCIGDSDSNALHAATEWLEPAPSPVSEAPAAGEPAQ